MRPFADKESMTLKSKLTVSMGKVYFLAKFWMVPAATSFKGLELCNVGYSADHFSLQECGGTPKNS